MECLKVCYTLLQMRQRRSEYKYSLKLGSASTAANKMKQFQIDTISGLKLKQLQLAAKFLRPLKLSFSIVELSVCCVLCPVCCGCLSTPRNNSNHTLNIQAAGSWHIRRRIYSTFGRFGGKLDCGCFYFKI